MSLRRWSLIALLVSSCTFDEVRPAIVDGGEDGREGDAGACFEACDGDVLVRCDGATPVRTECAAGCTGDAEPRCAAMLPSNGVGLIDLVEVPATAFVVPAGRTYTIKTDLGLITDETGNVIRPATPGGGLHVDTASVYQQRSETLALFAVDSLTVEAGAVLRGDGNRALIVLARRDIAVAGAIDFSAGCRDDGRPVCGGPGGGTGGWPDTPIDAQGCAPGGNGRGATGAGAPGADTGGGGGGLGGSGAAGGDALWEGQPSQGGRPGEVSDACPSTALVPLKGGSGGGAGGRGDTNGGFGGGGGGALQLSSFSRIAVDSGGASPALLLANGAGGSAPIVNAQGGGGGGSGGALLVEAPEVVVAAGSVLAANGGGGGGGTGPSTDPGRNGAPGGAFAARALGGSGNEDGLGYGGQGGARSGPPTAGGDYYDGSGGGGGGVGIVRINTRSLTVAADAVISPMHTEGEVAIE